MASVFISEETDKQETSMKKTEDRAGSFLGLLFNSIDGGNMFL
jgi:hypothetical protein